ncbi:hypothetical protein DRQ53_13440 [bacterium]|nr:MAG: hypothetical protein DRQ53_13440 [bacterium]
MPRVHILSWILPVLFAGVASSGTAHADASLAIQPTWTVVDPGAEFVVTVALPVAGTPINGYDAVVGFDPDRVELLLPIPRSDGEGALFTTACPQRFLSISVAPDSTAVTVSHVLLCAGTAVAGPGDTYELRFRAKFIEGQTHIRLLVGTATYDAGEYVEPLHTTDAGIWIGDPSASPAAVPKPQRLIAVPNPFNPSTELRFDVLEAERLRVDLFTISGRAIAELFDGEVPAGLFRLPWNGRDSHGRSLASGVYIARLTTSTGFQTTTRLVLLR